MRPPAELNWVDTKLAVLRPPAEWQPAPRPLPGATVKRAPRQLAYAAGTLAAIVVALAFPQSRVFAARCVDACVARFSVLGARPAPAGVDRQPAPTFRLPDATGRTVSLQELKGKVVILNFWATWCEPCRTEIPWFQELSRAHRDQGLVIVGVSMDEDGWEVVRPFIQRNAMNYPVVLGTDTVASAYGGVEALPTTLVIDRSGRIAYQHRGLIPKATYETEVAGLIAER